MPKDTFLNLEVEKQEKVMRAAITEFSKHGYEKGNVASIAKTAGVAKGSMYQYFENKKEIFLFSVKWSMDFFMKKYNNYIDPKQMKGNIFDYMIITSRDMWEQIREEREIVIFLHDVFLGKYKNLTEKSMEYVMEVSNKYLEEFIIEGKKNGYIRKDIDDNILAMYMMGVSLKIKEYLINKARLLGSDIIDEPFEVHEKELQDIMKLLKNGMGA